MLLLGACGKKDEPAASTSGQSSSGSSVTTKAGGSTNDTSKSTGSTPGTATKGTAVGNTALNQTVWYQGFKLTLGAINYDKENQKYLIDTDIENLGAENAGFYPDNMSVEDSGTQVTTVGSTENPTVLGASKAKTKLTFELDPDKNSTLKGLMLVMGKGNQAQVKVPLDGATAGLATLKPIPQPSVKGDLVVGQVTLTPTAAEVRFDSISDHTHVDKGKANFVIVGKAKNGATDSTLYLESGKVSMSLPDGTKQTAEKFTSADGLDATKTIEFALSFIIPDPYAGDYTLTFTQDWGPEGAATDETVQFSLTSTASGTTSGTTPGSTPGTTKK